MNENGRGETLTPSAAFDGPRRPAWFHPIPSGCVVPCRIEDRLIGDRIDNILSIIDAIMKLLMLFL